MITIPVNATHACLFKLATNLSQRAFMQQIVPLNNLIKTFNRLNKLFIKN